MNILMIVHSYYPEDARVLRESLALSEDGHVVDVLCLRRPEQGAREERMGVGIIRLPVRRHRGGSLLVYLIEYFSFAFMSFVAILKRPFYDVYYVHNPPDFLAFVPFLQKFLGRRVVLDIHDRVPKLYASRFNKLRPALWMTRIVEQAALVFADRIITVHEPYKKELADCGADVRRITCVMNTADERLFKPSSNSSEGYIMHHGTIVERYGADVLVLALKQLGRKATCHIFGEGDFLSRLRAMVRELDLEDMVKVNGLVPISELPEKISRCALGVVPHRRDEFTEGVLPTKMLEYIAMKKPVIVSRTKVIEYYFSESEVTFAEPGSHADLAEKLGHFFREPSTFSAQADRAYEKYLSISWGVQRKKLTRVIKELEPK